MYNIATFKSIKPIILASSSPRRLELLQSMGMDFKCIHPKGLEPTPLPREPALDYAIRAAKAKLESLIPDHANSVIVAADTIVTLDNKIFGKPADKSAALHMLSLLAGQRHQVITALCIHLPNEDCHIIYDIAKVTMYSWPKEILKAYVKTGESLDKAGAYAIQGKGAFLIEAINGSWSTVVGLPLTDLMAFFVQNNIIIPYAD